MCKKEQTPGPRAQLSRELDRLGGELAACSKQEDGRRKALYTEIANRVVEYIGHRYRNPEERDKKLTAFFEMYAEGELENFDAAAGSLSGFIWARISNYEINLYRKENDLHRTTQTNPKTGKKERRWESRTIQPTKDEDDAWTDPTAALEDHPADDAHSLAAANDTMADFLTLFLSIRKNLHGRAVNEIKLRYFRLFFTDQLTDMIYQRLALRELRRRERDVFEVLEKAFLDFFLDHPCRTVNEIYCSRQKPYGAMVPGRPMDRVPRLAFLPEDVYSTYLKEKEHYTAGSSAISQQLESYRKYWDTLFPNHRKK